MGRPKIKIVAKRRRSDSEEDELAPSEDEITQTPMDTERDSVDELEEVKPPKKNIIIIPARRKVSSDYDEESERTPSLPVKRGPGRPPGKQRKVDSDDDFDELAEEAEEAEASDGSEDEMDEDEFGYSDGSGSAAQPYLTARQRRRAEGSSGDEGEFLALPMDDPSRKKHFTSEELEMRRAEKNRRRRHLADRRLEEVKQATIDKLLRRKERDGGNEATDLFEEEKALPTQARHIFSKEKIVVLWPQGVQFPLDAVAGTTRPPKVIPCVICGKPKKYAHSKTYQPLCSLACYQKVK